MTALDVMSSPESMKGPCTEWRSVDSECSTAAQSLAFSEEESEPHVKHISPKAETCIIFDWDDTLLPSSFLEDAARMYSSYSSPNLRRRAGRSRTGAGLPNDFPCYKAIQEHGELIAKALRLAKSYGDVAIVTLSDRPWVFESADQYVPGLDMAGLLKELQIPIYYAPEHVTGTLADVEDLNVTMKRNAMREFLSHRGAGHGLNLISIGDSSVEKEAAQACSRMADLDGMPSLCKTIKLIGDPSLRQLNQQLQSITAGLESICAHRQDLDLHVQSPEDLAAQLAQLRH